MLKSFLYHNLVEAGCDEAGRGCLAGPVVAAAVILPKNFKHPVLNDSKLLTAKQRAKLREEIISSAIDWKVAFIDNREIDELNILRASIKAMHVAIEGLRKEPQFLLIDGNRFYPYKKIKHQTIIKGDGLYYSIAAASVLAKTFRDDYMESIHNEYPDYNWAKNKGYPTAEHRRAIIINGISPYHRKSFHLFDTQMKLEF
jgi:ribonuclease HII